MLDYRAWIVACVILLSAAGAYLLWIYRPKATYNARSLSAGAHPSDTATKPVTKPLHVDGCRQDFIVSPGELVEPTVVPGASLDSFHDVYGKETKRDPQGALTWDKYEYSLTADGFGGGNPGSSLWISLNSGHILESLDGVEQGLDSMGAHPARRRPLDTNAFTRLRMRGQVSQRVFSQPSIGPGDRSPDQPTHCGAGWRAGTAALGCLHEQGGL
jgi:hypothetical protein